MDRTIFKFTKASIDALTPSTREIEYTDTDNKNLKLRVSPKGTKTFSFSKKYKNKHYRQQIGTYPTMTVSVARSKASECALKVEKGEPLIEQKIVYETLGELFEKYKEHYYSHHSTKLESCKKTLRTLELYFSEYFSKKINTITGEDVFKIVELLRKKGKNTQANAIIRTGRAMFNVFIRKIDGFKIEMSNPFNDIKVSKISSRKRYVEPREMPALWESIEKENNIFMRSFFKLSLFVGTRVSELLNLKWDDVDFSKLVLTLRNTKNGEDREIPFSPETKAILDCLFEKKLEGNDFVFWSNTSSTGHIVEVKKSWKRILNRANIKDLHIHDLRRTNATYQNSKGVSKSIISEVLGHKSEQITGVYAKSTDDAKRLAMEIAENSLLETANVKKK